MASPPYQILVLPGDHAGPEVMTEALKVLSLFDTHLSSKTSSKTPIFAVTKDLAGGCSINVHGIPITPSVLAKAASSHAILFGSVGGPEWGTAQPNPESGLLQLRKHIGAFANLRPCKWYSKSLVEKSPLKEDVIRDVDFMLLRENCGGAYFGEKVEDYDKGVGSDSWIYTVPEVERCAHVAASLALQEQALGKPGLVTSADKANVLASGRLWRRAVTSIFSSSYSQIPLQHQLADSLSMLLCTKPSSFNGIILTDNTFGDMLSDQSGGLLGTLGVLPSASLCASPTDTSGKPVPVKGLYEPVHGSAPDIAGQGRVNPVAEILSVAMMLRYSFCLLDEATLIEKAVEKVLDGKDIGGLEIRTGDLGGSATTSEVGDAVCRVLKELLASR
ncbi:3-isopropylmalate dehydrogenase [Venturia nashicola]|nr:3-isopropylmalate dehydrogenase [Venturia nashicola]